MSSLITEQASGAVPVTAWHMAQTRLSWSSFLNWSWRRTQGLSTHHSRVLHVVQPGGIYTGVHLGRPLKLNAVTWLAFMQDLQEPLVS